MISGSFAERDLHKASSGSLVNEWQYRPRSTTENQYMVQHIAFGVSFPHSQISVVDQQDQRLRFEHEEMTLQMQYAVPCINTHVCVCVVCRYT